MLRGLISRILVVVFCTAVGHGIVIAFHLDAIAADLIRRAIAPIDVAAASWVISGLIGLLGLLGWENRHKLTALFGSQSKPADQNNVVRDVWLYDAISRMFLGQWRKIPVKDGQFDLSANGFQAVHDLLERVRQLAFDGVVPVWGKKPGGSALWEKQEPAFWKSNEIDYHSFTDADAEKLRAVPRNTSGQITSLRELMTSRAAVEAICHNDAPGPSLPTNDANALRIVVGLGAPFDEIAVNKYGVHHTIRAGIKNVGSRRIANCNFYRIYVAFTNDSQKTLLDGPFSLDPDECRYVSIAMFNETKDLPHANHLIGLSMPVAAAGYGVTVPQLPPDRRYVVSFLAQSPDCTDAELHGELRVDENGKLRFDLL